MVREPVGRRTVENRCVAAVLEVVVVHGRFIGIDVPFERFHDLPGERLVYNSGCSMLLSDILRRGTGMAVDEFAAKYLFEPIGIDTGIDDLMTLDNPLLVRLVACSWNLA